MKTSAVLASALLSAFTVAAPVDKRALVYQTEIVTETVVIYTTIYDDDYVPEATTTPEGLFYEQPETSSSVVVVPTSSAAPASAPQVQEASSAPAPASETPTPSPSPSPVATPTPAPVVEQPEEKAQPTTSAYVAPAPAPEPSTSSAAPAVASPAPVASQVSQASTAGTTTGESFTNVDMTVYDNNGAFGACGTALYDTDMIVALSKDAWGASTYDVMTGAATNPWCGQKIQVQYGGNTVEATIMDLCPGCSGHDIDLSWAAWKAVTGVSTPERFQASWSKIA